MGLFNLALCGVVGLSAGFIADRIMKANNSLVFNLIVGLIGGVVGRIIFILLGIHIRGLVGVLSMSVSGSVALLWLISFLKKKSTE